MISYREIYLKKILFISVIIMLISVAFYARSIILKNDSLQNLKQLEEKIASDTLKFLKKGYASTDGTVIVVPDDWKSEEIEWFKIPSSSTEKGWLLYSLTDKGKNMEEIVIPETIDGKPVTSICIGAFFLCPNLASVIIPDTIQSIAEKAFIICPKLKSITSSADFFDAVGGVSSPVFAGCRVSEWNYTGDGLEVEFGFRPLE